MSRKEYTELNRCVTRREYEKVLDYAFELGIENGFFQDGETARESFIPAFDYEGVRKCHKIKNSHKWKEAGTFVPARMKKKNIYKKDSSSF